jgi:hypothetical protein
MALHIHAMFHDQFRISDTLKDVNNMTSNSIGITDERDILSMPFTLTQGA